ncbi:LPS assembly lipoprotein LptE [Belnapia rosea]|uniref:Lipopolysaccharide-assembly n=1 Tax=Belnapia rosea TaxID=938405 RepID=A0A1G6QGR8_9PROT|nr:LPS assembly lipoprotein LptE [Belnapia rosea]SDB64526.1 Lipopolysaccharide-assembly [Belnapia rosea]SDC91672.1 Lipopolysaccharide-assembly [Belnapia rosea]
MSRDVSSISWSRRGLLGGLLGLSACGFRPLYGPIVAEDGSEEDLRSELAAVRIGPLYERTGQLLRRSLQRRMEDSAPGTPARYLLNVSVDMGTDILGYRRDGTPTRIRFTLNGSWNLNTIALSPQRIAASGIPYRAIDSFNIPDLQFFSADVSRDAALERLMEDLSQEITRQVAMALRQRKEDQGRGDQATG